MSSTQHQELFNNLERHSIDGLCSIGRELVQDLMQRTMQLMSLLKMKVNSSGHVEVDTIINHCNFTFKKLLEIRTIIDERRAMANECEPMDLVSALADPTPPPVDKRRRELAAEFERNRAKLLDIDCQLKRLEWIAAISDPRLIKKSDLTTADDAIQ